MMQNLGNRRSVQKCAQNAGSNVLNAHINYIMYHLIHTYSKLHHTSRTSHITHNWNVYSHRYTYITYHSNESYTLHTTVSVYMNEIKVWMYIYYWQWQSRITSAMVVVVLSFLYKMKFVVLHKMALKLQCTFKCAW